MLIRDREFLGWLESERVHYLPERPLAEYSSLGVGGRADLLVLERTDALEPLAAALAERGIDWGLLGGGTNILPADDDFRKVFLKLAPADDDVAIDGATVRIRTAASLGRSVMQCARRDLGGMEGLAGVPGSVGGALRMNAGAYGMQMGSMVRSVEIFRGDTGRREVLPAGRIGFQYRKSSFAPRDIMLSVELELQPKPFREILDSVRIMNEKRRSSQPLKEKSAGCIFKNPPGLSTGRLIDELGMKGLREGGAVISERHANFIVNRHGGTASDIFRLMDRIRSRVLAAHGIELEEEVIVWRN